MAIEVPSATIYFGGIDVSGVLNDFRLPVEVETAESTNFDSGGWKEFVGTLKSPAWTYQGFFPNTAEPGAFYYNDDASDPAVVLGGSVATVPCFATYTASLADEDVAYGMNCVRAGIERSMTVGDLDRVTVNMVPAAPMVKGQILGAVSAATSTSTTTGFQFGAATAAQRIYCSLHCTSITASDTLDVTVESDDNSGFTSPATRFTFTQVTDANTHAEEYLELAGAVTDDWWRVSYTIAGSAPSFDFVVFMGIQ